MPDLLGDRFEAHTLKLAPDAAGEAVATLVRLRAAEAVNGAILYVHGFADYFFQVHVAEHFADRGRDFYALDLRAYGRSMLPHQQPNFVQDLGVYDEEIDAALAAVRADGHERVVVMGHSTGGLITALWAHDRRDAGGFDALILNSPWLDLQKSWLMRTAGTKALDAVGRRFPQVKIQNGLPEVYGQSLHATARGEWDYDLELKPHTAFPVRAGWMRAIRRGHARVHAGLDIRVPVLVMHSTRSRLSRRWSEDATRADTVLDVEQIARWAPSLGRDVSVVPIQDGLHDLFLSAPPVRERALKAADDFFTARLGG